jgi:hypothetical protein
MQRDGASGDKTRWLSVARLGMNLQLRSLVKQELGAKGFSRNFDQGLRANKGFASSVGQFAQHLLYRGCERNQNKCSTPQEYFDEQL